MKAREAARTVRDVLALGRGLAVDPLVPWYAKAMLGLLVIYLASPIDLIPDFIPVIGQADDIVIAGLVLAFVARVTGPNTIERHWRGDPAVMRRLLRQ